MAACLLAIRVCAAAEAEGVLAIAGASADALLEDVCSRLPLDPLTLTGRLFVRKPRGIPVRDYAFEMTLRYGSTPPEAVYTIRASPAGPVLETVTVRRPEGGVPQYTRVAGEGVAAAPLDDLHGRIQETDLTWLDLSLSFLWWRGGLVVGPEDVRGRPAIVIDVAPPVGDAPAPYARVRLWIDEQTRILLQAEGYDAGGHAVRTLWVKSFKKIKDRWMVKDLEVQQYPAVHRTKLRINDAGSAPETGTEASDPSASEP